MQTERIEIGTGIALNYVPLHKFKTNYFSVNFIVPLAKKTASDYSLLINVLRRGTEKYPTQAELCRRLEELYSSDITAKVAKKGEEQVLTFTADMLDNRYAYDGTDITGCVFDLMEEVLFHPALRDAAFVPSVVEREKVLLKDAIRAEINQKVKYAVNRCKELMCQNEVYGISENGNGEDVDKITPQSLYASYLTLLKEATIEVFYIGSEPLLSLSDRVNKLFSTLKVRTPKRLKTVIVPKAETVHRITEKMAAAQGKLTLGFRMGAAVDESNGPAINLFNSVLGLSPTSKLFMNVREKLSLCYYCQSVADKTKGILLIYSGVENGNAEKAETAILKQVEKIRLGEITEEEMICAKQCLKGIYQGIEDTCDSIETWTLSGVLSQTGFISPEQMTKKIFDLTVADVRRIAESVSLDTVYFLEGTGKEAVDEE